MSTKHVLVGGGHVGRLVMVLGPDVGRLVQMAPGERHDLRRHGGREEHGLAVIGREPQDRLDVGQEPEIEHPVGLVEHQHVHVRQVQPALPGQVEKPSRGADNDVDGGQRLDLRLVRAPAVEGDHVNGGAGTRGAQVIGDLDGQFPGRDDN